jgi:hypothetical protein
MRTRRNNRNFERLVQRSEAHITWAPIRVIVRRLAAGRIQPETYPTPLALAA